MLVNFSWVPWDLMSNEWRGRGSTTYLLIICLTWVAIVFMFLFLTNSSTLFVNSLGFKKGQFSPDLYSDADS